jgi:hypothetical protein
MNTKRLRPLALALPLLASLGAAKAADIRVDLTPSGENPAKPIMGEWMHFRSVIRNAGDQPIAGLVAWISLVQVTPGKEQPMDLEDWSAHKAVAGAALAPGGVLFTDWPMRLIQGGDYRVVVSATERADRAVYTSQTLQFHIARKPVVASRRILPVAFGVPLLITALIGYNGLRRHRRRAGTQQAGQ